MQLEPQWRWHKNTCTDCYNAAGYELTEESSGTHSARILVMYSPIYMHVNSSVGIATGYGLDDQGWREFESR
jgi:hypothetical protein